MLAQTISKIGKHKIPRFIYHMTNKRNYESMLRDGVIKTSGDELFGKGVFATELTNFFKNWRTNAVYGGSSLQDRLIRQVTKGQDEIVMLKIPTSKLDHDRLFIRSQNRLIAWGKTGRAEKAFDFVENSLINEPDYTVSRLDQTVNLFKSFLFKNESKCVAEHLTSGAPAKMSSLYKQRKEAIEYIYLDDILMSNVERIGEVNIESLKKTLEYDSVQPIKSIFVNLLKGTPEVKGAELLSC